MFSRNRLSRTRQVKRRPTFEVLEDRLVPATFHVTTPGDLVDPGDGKLSLREAVSRANATEAADTIVLGAGMYQIEAAGAGEDGNATGDFDVTRPLTIKGAGANASVIDAVGLDRAFDLIGTFEVRFSRLTIRNAGGAVFGGAIQAPSADVTLSGCKLIDNTALRGGAIHTESGDVMLIRSKVMGNEATAGNGGGINTGTGFVALRESTVSNNSSTGSGGGIRTNTAGLKNSVVSLNRSGNNGGGIAANTAFVVASTVSDNKAEGAGSSGGGMLIVDVATLIASTVRGNTAGEDGGGIVADQAFLTASTVRDNVAAQDGGGIFAPQADLTACTVSGNRAEGPDSSGGGMRIVQFATVTASTIRDNTAGADGGGIELGNGILTACRISGNTAVLTGGGIRAQALTLTDSILGGNQAGAGGGLYGTGVVRIDSSTLRDNTADAGAGIYQSGNEVELRQSLLHGNHATGSGGGLYVNVGTTASLINVTISGNSAETAGGGLFALSSQSPTDISLLNVTITRNTSSQGGGIWNAGIAQLFDPAALLVRNTIIARNSTDALLTSGWEVFGSVLSLGHNLVGMGEGSTGFAAPGDQVGTGPAPLNARLRPLADNGGPTLTHALRTGSTAIDQGDPSGAPVTDQRGVARPRDGDGDGTRIVDIGAFELKAAR